MQKFLANKFWLVLLWDTVLFAEVSAKTQVVVSACLCAIQYISKGWGINNVTMLCILFLEN